jgi:hypothetical protein
MLSLMLCRLQEMGWKRDGRKGEDKSEVMICQSTQVSLLCRSSSQEVLLNCNLKYGHWLANNEALPPTLPMPCINNQEIENQGKSEIKLLCDSWTYL